MSAEATSTEARRPLRSSEVRGFAARTLALLLVLLTCHIQDGRADEQLPPTTSTVSSQPSPSPQMLAGDVYLVFQARCTDCHGADLLQPKGKFGYILDLARVAANPKLVVPGKPLQSELFQTVFHDEMPPPKSKRPPLTAEEKDMVKSWIEAGAPATLPPGDGGKGRPPADLAPAPHSRPRTIPSPVHSFSDRPADCRVAGRIPVETHPQGFLEGNGSVLRHARCGDRRDHGNSGLVRRPIFNLRRGLGSRVDVAPGFGTGTAIWAVLLAALAEFSNQRGNPPRLSGWFGLTLVVGAVLVSVAGYLGASLIYGLNHFSW